MPGTTYSHILFLSRSLSLSLYLSLFVCVFLFSHSHTRAYTHTHTHASTHLIRTQGLEKRPSSRGEASRRTHAAGGNTRHPPAPAGAVPGQTLRPGRGCVCNMQTALRPPIGHREPAGASEGPRLDATREGRRQGRAGEVSSTCFLPDGGGSVHREREENNHEGKRRSMRNSPPQSPRVPAATRSRTPCATVVAAVWTATGRRPSRGCHLIRGPPQLQ